MVALTFHRVVLSVEILSVLLLHRRFSRRFIGIVCEGLWWRSGWKGSVKIVGVSRLLFGVELAKVEFRAFWGKQQSALLIRPEGADCLRSGPLSTRGKFNSHVDILPKSRLRRLSLIDIRASWTSDNMPRFYVPFPECVMCSRRCWLLLKCDSVPDVLRTLSGWLISELLWYDMLPWYQKGCSPEAIPWLLVNFVSRSFDLAVVACCKSLCEHLAPFHAPGSSDCCSSRRRSKLQQVDCPRTIWRQAQISHHSLLFWNVRFRPNTFFSLHLQAVFVGYCSFLELAQAVFNTWNR